MNNWKIAAYMHSSGISIRKWAKANNVCYNNIRDHILAGMTPDEACNYAQSRKGKHDTSAKHFIDGLNLCQYCKLKNLNYSTMLRRCKTMSVEEAVTLPINANKRRKGNGK